MLEADSGWPRDVVEASSEGRRRGGRSGLTTTTGTPEREDIDEVYAPDPVEFGSFVRAVATRYPQVDYWSIYNEPNQPAWLSPQWVKRDGGWEEASPRLYRDLLDAAWTALQTSGHGDDTILIGETAPKGLRTNRGETRSIDALRFLRHALA